MPTRQTWIRFRGRDRAKKNGRLVHKDVQCHGRARPIRRENSRQFRRLIAGEHNEKVAAIVTVAIPKHDADLMRRGGGSSLAEVVRHVPFGSNQT